MNKPCPVGKENTLHSTVSQDQDLNPTLRLKPVFAQTVNVLHREFTQSTFCFARTNSSGSIQVCLQIQQLFVSLGTH